MWRLSWGDLGWCALDSWHNLAGGSTADHPWCDATDKGLPAMGQDDRPERGRIPAWPASGLLKSSENQPTKLLEDNHTG